MANEKVSIVVPIRNMAGRLENLEGWLTQIRTRDIQVVLVHDFAESGTQMELERIVRDYKSIDVHLIKVEFGSPGLARNEGLKHCRNDWIIFADSDDILVISELYKVMSRLSSGEYFDGIVCGYRIENKNRMTISRFVSSSKWDIAYNPGLWRMIIRKSILGENPFRKFLVGEDQLFLAEIGIFSKSILFVENEIYVYFQGIPGQLTSNKSSFNELESAIAEVSKWMSTSRNGEQKFVSLVFLRLTITYFKHTYGVNQLKSWASLVTHTLEIFSRHPIHILRSVGVFLGKKTRQIFHQPKSIVYVTGGLGNQLFQLAAGLYRHSSRINLEQTLGKPRMTKDGRMALEDFVLPHHVRVLPKRKFKRNFSKVFNFLLRRSVSPKFARQTRGYVSLIRIFAKLAVFVEIKKFANLVIAKDNGYSKLEYVKRGNEFLIGYFQTYEWLNDDYTKLAMNSLRLKEVNPDLEAFLAKFQGHKKLMIHIRMGDYRDHDNFGILPTSYFASSLSLLKEIAEVSSYTIWLFSDEPSFAFELLPPEWQEKSVIVPDFGGEACVTLEAMRHADAYIISNSTLSWWGAQLRYNKGAKVIAPSPWFRNEIEPNLLIPTEWERVRAW